MAVNLLVSNSLETLSQNLADNIKFKKNAIFNPITISVQTEGMVYWLREQIAICNGIAANLDFLKPNQVIYAIYALLNNISGNELSRDSIILLIYNVLNEDRFKIIFPEIATYYQSGNILNDDIKRLNLAEKTADLFDQYQIYRTDIIEHWNEQKLKSTHRFEQWQAFIWQRIKESNNFHDKISTRNAIFSALNEPNKQELLATKFPQIYFFGLSVVTQYHIDILMEIGKYTEVTFFLINPSPDNYWFDDLSLKDILKRKIKSKNPVTLAPSGNPLLASWGKTTQNTFKLLFNREEIINAYEIIDIEIPKEDSLLHKLQLDLILGLDDINQNITNSDLLDNTIHISECYSPFREIQALYDYLIEMAHLNNNQIKNRDIVVMATDINAYAPYIKAVFDNAPIPLAYKIADTKLLLEDNMLNALNEILLINEQNFTAERVISLLKFQCILQKFDLTGEKEIREIILKANIRYGINGDKNIDTRKYSWTYGLKKLVYGLCLKNDDEIIYNDENDSFLPLNYLEGAAALDIINLQNFVNTLIKHLEDRTKTKSISEWGIFIKETATQFIDLRDESTEKEMQELTNIIESLNELSEVAATLVSFEVFYNLFQKHLSIYETKQNFTGSGITFCSLVPMRSIPFSTVAILGLNYGVFPRTDNSTEYDLMNPKYGTRLGDRNLKEGDKHLFLESVLSARNNLYLSYIGHSVKNNKPIPPSPILEELINYLGNKCTTKNEIDKIVIHHALHSFSAKYNNGQNGLVHYKTKDIRTDIFTGLVEANKKPIERLKLADLITTINNTPEIFYKNNLNITDHNINLNIPEGEEISPNNLQKSVLYKEAILSIIAKEDINTQKEKWSISGDFPLNHSGDYLFNTTFQKAFNTLYNNNLSQHKLNQHNYDLKIGDITISHSEYWDDKHIIEVFKNNSPLKNIINLYIKSLFYTALGKQNTYILIGENNSETYFFHQKVDSITKEDATQKLIYIIELYEKAFNSPIPFGASWIKPNKKDVKLDEYKIENYLTTIKELSSSYNIYTQLAIKEFQGKEQNIFEEAYKTMVEPMIKTIVQPALKSYSNEDLLTIFK